MKPDFISSVESQASRKAIRELIRRQRRSISNCEQQDFAFNSTQLMLTELANINAKHVALYLTNDGELDTAILIEALWQQGINVYLPRLHPFSKGNLIFLAYTCTTPLQQNSLKIWEPRLDITQMILPHEIDVVVTPLVAFDNQGNRMGMGGGYYDRTLEDWRLTGKPYPVGLAHDCQQVDSLPCEHWDVPLPMLVTPTRVLRFVSLIPSL